MRTHRDIVNDALVSLGVVRPGQATPGDQWVTGQKALLNMMDELNEHPPGLDFDATDDDAVPNERATMLAQLLANHPIFDSLDTERGYIERRQTYEIYRQQLMTAVIGPSDFIESEVDDF